MIKFDRIDGIDEDIINNVTPQPTTQPIEQPTPQPVTQPMAQPTTERFDWHSCEGVWEVANGTWTRQSNVLVNTLQGVAPYANGANVPANMDELKANLSSYNGYVQIQLYNNAYRFRTATKKEQPQAQPQPQSQPQAEAPKAPFTLKEGLYTYDKRNGIMPLAVESTMYSIGMKIADFNYDEQQLRNTLTAINAKNFIIKDIAVGGNMVQKEVYGVTFLSQRQQSQQAAQQQAQPVQQAQQQPIQAQQQPIQSQQQQPIQPNAENVGGAIFPYGYQGLAGYYLLSQTDKRTFSYADTNTLRLATRTELAQQFKPLELNNILAEMQKVNANAIYYDSNSNSYIPYLITYGMQNEVTTIDSNGLVQVATSVKDLPSNYAVVNRMLDIKTAQSSPFAFFRKENTSQNYQMRKEITTLIIEQLKLNYGGLDAIYYFGVDTQGCIIINEADKFQLEVAEEVYLCAPTYLQKDMRAGNWGRVFHFDSLRKFNKLNTVALPTRTMYETAFLGDLGIADNVNSIIKKLRYLKHLLISGDDRLAVTDENSYRQEVDRIGRINDGSTFAGNLMSALGLTPNARDKENSMAYKLNQSMPMKAIRTGLGGTAAVLGFKIALAIGNPWLLLFGAITAGSYVAQRIKQAKANNNGQSPTSAFKQAYNQEVTKQNQELGTNAPLMKVGNTTPTQYNKSNKNNYKKGKK